MVYLALKKEVDMISGVAKTLNIVSERELSWLESLLLIGLGSLLMSLVAPLSIHLPFTPVPIALAPHIALALGALLGSKRGALAVMGYLLQGLFGLPVFALTSGVAILLGPSGGYLLGYVAGAYLTGYLLERKKEKTEYALFSAFAFGNLAIYFFGVCHLTLYTGFKMAILLGICPFIFGDILKILLLTKGLKRANV